MKESCIIVQPIYLRYGYDSCHLGYERPSERSEFSDARLDMDTTGQRLYHRWTFTSQMGLLKRYSHSGWISTSQMALISQILIRPGWDIPCEHPCETPTFHTDVAQQYKTVSDKRIIVGTSDEDKVGRETFRRSQRKHGYLEEYQRLLSRELPSINVSTRTLEGERSMVW